MELRGGGQAPPQNGHGSSSRFKMHPASFRVSPPRPSTKNQPAALSGVSWHGHCKKVGPLVAWSHYQTSGAHLPVRRGGALGEQPLIELLRGVCAGPGIVGNVGVG